MNLFARVRQAGVCNGRRGVQQVNRSVPMKSFLRIAAIGWLVLGASALSSPAESIHLNAGTIDTGRAAKSVATRAVAADFSGSRLHLVQFDGPIQPEWVAQLNQAGYQVVDYIPDNAYLVYGGSAALQSVRARAKHCEVGRGLSGQRQDPSAGAACGGEGPPGADGRR
jgi:hypothetical protein